MKKFAKLLAMVLAVSMVLTMFVGAFDYVDAADIDEDKVEAVEAVYAAGIMMGNNKDEFNAKDTLTRDEMAKILFALASYEQKAEDYYGIVAAATFADYDKIPTWSKAYVGYASAENYIVGNAKGEANALGTLSYVEAAIMLMRTLDLEGTYDDGGDDPVPSFTGSKWYQNAVLTAYQNDLFADLDVTNFMANITREDVAVMIYNAIGHANADYYLATSETYTLTGVAVEEEDDEEVVYAIVDGDTAIEVAMTEEAVEELLGLEITAIVEDGEMLEITAGAPVYADTALWGDIDWAVEVEDEEYVNLEIDGEVIVEEFEIDAYDIYVSLNTNEGYSAAGMPEIADYDEVLVIVNEGSICLKYAPVVFDFFAEDEWADGVEEIYDAEKKEWTGTYEIDGLAINAAYAELEVEGWVSYQVIDDELVNLGFLKAVASADLDVAFDAAEAEYTVAYEGAELVNLTEVTEGTIWQNVLKGEEYTAYLYNDYVLVAYEEVVEEEEVVEDTVFYAIINGYTASVEIVTEEVEEEEVTKYVWTTTIDVTIDGVDKEIVIEVEQEDLTYVKPAVVDYAFAKITIDGETEEMTAEEATLNYAMVTTLGEEDLVAGELALEDLEDVLFFDCTEAGLTLADVAVETEGEKTTTKVDGKKVSALSVMAFWVDADYVVVVYDPACEFGVWGEFIAD